MSIKDLFGKTSKDLEETVQDVESVKFVEEKSKRQERYLPPVDFSDPKNFVYYGSAELYYDAAIRRIYEDYPYDGSKAEQIEFEEKSSHLERWLFENRYPKTTGYIELGTTGDLIIGTGFQSTGTPEYIRVWGGLHTQDTTRLEDKFDKSAKYDESKNRNQNWNCDFEQGATIEFWMKKDTVTPTGTSEVILDLWNGESGSDIGRVLLYTFSATTNAFFLRVESGTSLFQGQIQSDSLDIQNWHHYAISMKQVNNQFQIRFYIDGVEDSLHTSSSTFLQIEGRIDGFIGAMQAPFGSFGEGDGKLSAKLDEFRFWKTARTARQIKLNWFSQVGGGANTDDATSDLGVYFKFNEGIVGNSTTDSVVLDYSGRLANGLWVGYPGSSARNTGSAIESVGYNEAATPIIYSNHPEVTALSTEMQTSGSFYDAERGQAFYNSMPTWLQQDDNGNLRKISQILASYLDTLHVQIKQMTELKNKDYTPEGLKASTMAQDLLKDKGFMTSNIFGMNEVYEKLSDLDIQDGQFESDLNETKNIIYTNIYNNLEKIYKSKGTETSIRNFIRCFGIDDELVKLNLYTDGGVHNLSDKSRVTSVKKKYINFNHPDYFSATIYQTSSAGNANTFISGSSTGTNASNNAFTLEADIVVPYKKERGESGYFGTPFVSSSVFGFHEADESDPSDYTFASTYGMQVYLVKDSVHSRNAKFVLDLAGTQLESDYVYDIYENTHWNIAISIKPETYPYAGGVTNTTPDYEVSLYAVSHDMHEGSRDYNEVGIYATLGNADGLRLTNMAKRVYAGAHRQDFTGAVLQKSDVEIGSIRGWLDYLEDEEIQNHNKDVLNYGSRRSIDGSNIYTVDNKQIPTHDLTILNWDFDTVLTSDVGGQFIVEDTTSGSTDTIYGWVDDVIRREHRARGDFFPSEDSSFLSNEFLYSLKKQLPETAYNSENIFIKGEQEINFSDDDDVSDNLFILEKSPANLVSEEMLKSFSTTMEFANLVGRPIDRYRLEYKDLAKARELFFNKVDSDLDFDRFFEYFKWIDSSISSMVNQLIPLSANFAGGIVDVVEPHILERDKYQRQIGLLSTVTSTEASIRGVQELNYNWKFGHAPLPTERIGNGEGSFTFGFSAAQDGDTITISGKTFEINKSGGVTPGNIELTFYALKGINNANIRNVIAAEFPNFTVTKSSDVNNPVYTIIDPSGNLTITTSSPGTFYDIVLVQSSFFTPTEAENCLWQKERKERETSEVEQLRQVIVRQTDQEFTNPINLSGSDGVYQGRTYATRRFSKPYSANIGFSNSIHGGINYDKNKNRYFLATVTRPHGETGTSNAPKNIMTIGAGDGHGLNPLIDCNDVENPNALIKRDGEAQIGKFSSFAPTTLLDPLDDSLHYVFKRKISSVFPGNIVSSSVNTGYASKINKSGLLNGFKEGINVVNLHSDTTDITNEIPMQGPFTHQWMGGHQSRHVDINKVGRSENFPNELDNKETRPEAWRLLIGTNPLAEPGDTDGAMGFTGPDYGSPYPVSGNLLAIYYREERTKRPVNIRNLRTKFTCDESGGFHLEGPLGNYIRRYEYLSNFGDLVYYFRRQAGRNLLPEVISDILPQTTHYHSLIAQTASAAGNFFGAGNNRQYDPTCILVPDPENEIPATSGDPAYFIVEDSDTLVPGHTIIINDETYTLTDDDNDGSYYDDLLGDLEIGLGPDYEVTLEEYQEESDAVDPVTGKLLVYGKTEDIEDGSTTGKEEGVGLFLEEKPSWSINQIVTETSHSVTHAFYLHPPSYEELSVVDPTDSSPPTPIDPDNSRVIFYQHTQDIETTTSSDPDAVEYNGNYFKEKAGRVPGSSLSIEGNNKTNYLQWIVSYRKGAQLQSGGVTFKYYNILANPNHTTDSGAYAYRGTESSVIAAGQPYTSGSFHVILTSNGKPTDAEYQAKLFLNGVSVDWDESGSFNEDPAETNHVTKIESFAIACNEPIDSDNTSLGLAYSNTPTILDEFMVFEEYYGSGTPADSDKIDEIYNNGNIWDYDTMQTKTVWSDLKAFYTFGEPEDGFFDTNTVHNKVALINNLTSNTDHLEVHDIPSGSNIGTEDQNRMDDSGVGNDPAKPGGYIGQDGDPLIVTRAGFSITPTEDGEFPGITIDIPGDSTGSFDIVTDLTGNFSDGDFTVSTETSFSGSSGTPFVPAFEEVCFGDSNIPETPNTEDCLSSTIRSRFSAPGGPEVLTNSFRSVHFLEFSVHNSLNYRNLMVRSNGSGEEGTIRVNSHSNRREGLRTLRARHQGQFGIDSQHGAISATNYVSEASFHKQHRNTRKVLKGLDSGPINTASSVVITTVKESVLTDPSGVGSSDNRRFSLTDALGVTTQFRITAGLNISINTTPYAPGATPYTDFGLVGITNTREAMRDQLIIKINAMNPPSFTATPLGDDVLVTQNTLGSAGNTSIDFPNGEVKFIFSGPNTFTGGVNAPTNVHDSDHIHTPLPASEFQYSWVNSAVSGSGWEDNRTIFGFTPSSGPSSDLGIPRLSEDELEFCLEIPSIEICYTHPRRGIACSTAIGFTIVETATTEFEITLEEVDQIWDNTSYNYVGCCADDIKYKMAYYDYTGAIVGVVTETGWTTDKPTMPTIAYVNDINSLVKIELFIKDCILTDKITIQLANAELSS